MGLDMYLEGKENGKEPIELGYWRKHPNLHGFIVTTFASGKDECQPIPLDLEDIRTIIAAVEKKELPSTSGFFFGASDGSEVEQDLEVLGDALKWVQAEKGRSVVYQASW